jgi:hypothetical protein
MLFGGQLLVLLIGWIFCLLAIVVVISNICIVNTVKQEPHEKYKNKYLRCFLSIVGRPVYQFLYQFTGKPVLPTSLPLQPIFTVLDIEIQIWTDFQLVLPIFVISVNPVGTGFGPHTDI